MAEITDEEIEAAVQHGRLLDEVEPRASAARYDQKFDRIVIELTNGSTFAFPPRLAQWLETMTPEQLSAVEVEADGYGLHWATHDVDFTVPGLLAGRFGTKGWLKGRVGKVKNSAGPESAHVSENEGGRPRKSA